MRRLILYLLIAAATFIFGVAVSRLSPKVSSPPKVNQPLAVPSCELQRNPEQYLGKLIRVRTVYVGNSTVYDWSCGSPDSLPSGLIYVDSPELGPRWIGENGVEMIVDEGIESEVVVVGIFEADHLAPYPAANARRFRITAESVFRISAPSVQR